ncbi:MAG: tRNA pseudouridine(38-40) synthase TruA [Deltaproteobacteria bacterium]|nr:tRNA pseudouridine(38-40) synthase TruA [Deltaproteobacteria bacterium]
MKKILCKIEYLGTHYHGWQIQKGSLPTIESELKNILEKILPDNFELKATSRTDAGVHAAGQIICFKVPLEKSLTKLFFSLNSLLPEDISVRDMVEVPLDFYPRKENKGKRYFYQIINTPMPVPVFRRDHWWIPKEMDMDILKNAGQLVVGTHDFTAFRGKLCQSQSPIKTIHSLEITSRDIEFGRVIRLEINGSSFMRHMIRILVGSLIDIAQGRLTSDAISKALRSKKRSDLGKTAPPHGLILDKIFFDPDPFTNREMEVWNHHPKTSRKRI